MNITSVPLSSPETPKFKTIGYKHLSFTYDYTDRTLVVGGRGESFTFLAEEVVELKAALQALAPDPDIVHFRGSVPRD